MYKTFQAPPERNRALHLRHIRYRGKTLEVLHKLKNCNPAFKAQIQSSSSRNHRDINTPGKKTRWAYKTALTGRRCEGINSGMGESKSIPFLHFTRRIGNSMLFAGIPLPRHGFRHLSSPQPCFTFPPRTDFQIVPESAASSYSVGSFQISVKQELAEIRRIETSLRASTWHSGQSVRL